MMLSLNDAWQHARRRGRVVRQFRSVENTKDLGLTISSDLSWGNHVLATVNRANMVLGLIKRSIETNNQDVFLRLYESPVRPLIGYAAPSFA